MGQIYTYRCTTDKLPMHQERIEAMGDVVLYGSLQGRDWTLVCRKGGDQ